MNIAALVIAILGLIATIGVAYLVNKRTKETLRRIEAILIAEKTNDEVASIERLIEDIERSGKRGTVVQRPNGSWGINWVMSVGGGSIKPSGKLKTRKSSGGKK